MKKRPLGNTGIIVSEIGFGAWQLGNKRDWGEMTDGQAIRLIHEAIDQGCNFFDTAPNYGLGNSEKLLGRALKGRRDSVVLSTKFGHPPDDEEDFSWKRLHESVEGSLERLQTDYLDLVLLHNPPHYHLKGNSPLYEQLEQLKRNGLVRAYGASVDSSREMVELMEKTESGVIEILFNVLHQEPAEAFPMAHEKGVGLIAKVPLDSGWLSGKYDAKSQFDGIRSRWSAELIERRAHLVDQIRFMIEEGMAEAALRFILTYPQISTVTPGVKNLEQLKANLSASDNELPIETMKRLQQFWQEKLQDQPLPW